MKPVLLVILLLALSCGMNGQEVDLPEGVVMETYDFNAGGKKTLSFYLRYPSSGKDDVRGVLFFCTPGEPGIYVSGGHLQNFTEEHKIAVVGFGQPGRRWNTTVNSDSLSGREAADQNQSLNAASREWSRLAKRFCRQHDLPESDWFIYGICGGAQFAHRLALRESSLFKAVHVHYGGSYDAPSQSGKSIHWLVTTHADEPCYMAAQQFFANSRALGYSMILKGYTRSKAPELYEGDFLGGGRGGLQQLSVTFFESVLTKEQKSDVTPSGEVFVADIVNGLVVPQKEASWIPPSQAVILKGKKLADAWKND